MFKRTKDYYEKKRRRYVRLNSIFPIEVLILDNDGNEVEGGFYQGFSKNVSLGGIKLEINKFDPAFVEKLIQKEYKLMIKMDIPPHNKTHPAIAEVTWVSKSDKREKYYLGLKYTKIEPEVRNELLHHAKMGIYRIQAIKVFILLLIVGVGYSYHMIKGLEKKTVDLQQKNITIAKDRSFYSNQIEKFRKNEEDLLAKLKEAEQKINKFGKMYDEVSKDDSLKKEVEQLKSERKSVKDRLTAIEKGRLAATKQLKKVTDFELDQKTAISLLSWMKMKQTRKFGLIPSFSGNKDVEAVSYTYDQALAVTAFGLFGNDARAKKILDFYKNFAGKDELGAYYNGYYTSGDPAEFVVHVGPNVWLGISAVQYFFLTGDPAYLQMARKIATWLQKSMDSDGGLKGGPEVSWYSTEHNLDAYAFFNMLYAATKNNEYMKSRDRVFGWIVEHAYDSKSKRFKRGKGDSTIATDTFSWGIAAIGPAALIKHSMDPFSIISYAEENCKETVSFRNRNGQIINVTGFDFAKARNLGRGGVISTEWTAQMIAAYKIMADFTRSTGNAKQSIKYIEKYRYYLNELQKMFIVASSKTGVTHLCLPYASQPDADTGHGWRTPGGKKTESLSGTAYYLFAMKGFNPISSRDNKKFYKVRQK
ncbi:MAG: PilZ domain-containing protein [Candidatus Aureabacteria bacterium]|nr:PilZ domain-containing protein [Candidatus Auribacterota bacterium]